MSKRPVRGLLLLILLAVPARAAVSSATVRLAVIEPQDWVAQGSLDIALDRLLRSSTGTARLLDVQSVPCYHSGSDYRLRLPPSLSPAPQQSFSTMSVTALEADAESALIFPPEPELAAKLAALAEDPGTYRWPWSVTTTEKRLTATQVIAPGGEALVTAQLDPNAGESAQWFSMGAELYRVTWHGREVSVVVMAKIFGGMGRLASALEREQKSAPWLGVARSDALGEVGGGLRGRELAEKLEALGLKYAAAGSAEIRRWKELEAYHRERPQGIQFLSANLVYSSAPAVTLLPDHAVVEQNGMKVCLVGMTPPEASKYLGLAGLTNATIAEPVQAFWSRAAALRGECGLVVLLGAVTPEAERLRHEAFGADVVLGEDARSPYDSAERASAWTTQRGRRDFDEPLWVMRIWNETLNLLEVEVSSAAGGRTLSARERHDFLDESVPWALGFAPVDIETFATTLSTEPALIPSARRVFAGAPSSEGFPSITPQNFWSLAAGLLAAKTGSELGVLHVSPLSVRFESDLPEAVVRTWLQDEEPAVIVYLTGSALKGLLAEARQQKERVQAGLPRGGKIGIAAGGIDEDDKVHGVAIDDRQVYKVATTKVVSDALGLSSERPPAEARRTADEIVLEALREKRGSEPPDYRRWMEGRPVAPEGFWKINFRDLSFNLQDTQVVRDDAFNNVPNSRIQGFSQFVVGGDLKTDADYLNVPYKWSNSLEMEYAQSQLSPRNQPHVINTPANRIMALTMLTRRTGAVSEKWLASSWGPSLGFQYDSEFVATPGLPRKQVYSAFPGLDFFDGTFVRKWEITANVKRDESRVPPNTQTGLHTRMLLGKDWGKAPVHFEGELWSNYFFLTQSDTDQDLRLEADVNFKLKIPIRKYLTIAPFMDVYVFELKVKPITGYSAMTGLSIGFSRLWKPGYEPF